MKPGYKTTEFWLSALATILGLVMASGILDTQDPHSWAVRIVGGLISLLASMGYTAGRSKVKSHADRPVNYNHDSARYY